MNIIAYRSRYAWKPVLGLLLAAVALSACTPTAAPPALTPVAVQFLWTHTNTFAGYYAADQNGYYTAEGLAVTFLQGGPNEIEKNKGIFYDKTVADACLRLFREKGFKLEGT